MGIDYRSADGVNGIEDIGLHDLRPSLALPRQRTWFVLAGPVDMIDVYFEFLDQRVELARLDDDGNPQPLEFLDSWTAGAQPADEDFEAGSVQVLRENLNRFLRPANPELIADLQNSDLRHAAGSDAVAHRPWAGSALWSTAA